MSVVTVGKNGRVYQRKFDWDDARRRHAEGETVAALARAYGVSHTAMKRACDDDFREAFDARRQASIHSGVCEQCGKTGVTSEAFRRINNKFSPDGRVLCAPCRYLATRERFRFDGDVLVAVRCSMVDCAAGDRWQPPENFNAGERYRDVRPKGFHSVCRACNTKIRREHRHRNREASNAYDRAYRKRRKAAA